MLFALHGQGIRGNPQALQLQFGALCLHRRRAVIAAGDRVEGPATIGIQGCQSIVEHGAYIQCAIEQGRQVDLPITEPEQPQGVVHIADLLERNVVDQVGKNVARYGARSNVYLVQANKRVALIQGQEVE